MIVPRDGSGSDPRWALLDAAKERLLRDLARDGVVRIEFVAAFPTQDAFAVWLCTSTDAQRDRLGVDAPLFARVLRVLLEVGFSAEQLDGVRTVGQSQETVDRDFAGSWFYALR